MTPYKQALVNYAAIVPKLINVVNQHTFHTVGCSNLPICVPNGVKFSNITLHGILYTPDIAQTLVSIGLIDETRYNMTFMDSTCSICNAACKIVGHFPKRERLYRVDTHCNDNSSISSMDTSLSMADAHCHLGHISPDAINQLCKNGLITGHTLSHNMEISTYHSCAYTKLTCKTIAKEIIGKGADSPGAEIHTDLWGASPVKSLGGKQYYISFTNKKTCYMCVYLLALKSEGFRAYLSFEAWLKTQHGTKIK